MRNQDLGMMLEVAAEITLSLVLKRVPLELSNGEAQQRYSNPRTDRERQALGSYKTR